MLAHLLIFVTGQDSPPTAASLLSKMIARYHGAKTIKGSCATRLKVGDQVIQIATDLQIERPGKLYVRQVVNDKAYVLTSDGKEFSYNKPVSNPGLDQHPDARLMEPVTGQTSLGDMYRAAGESLADRSAVLDLAISDPRDLSRLRDQWKSMSLDGETDLGGEKVFKITGEWRIDAGSEPGATFHVYVTKDGDLKKYVLEHEYALDQDKQQVKVHVLREYTVKLDVDKEVDPKLFTVLK